MEDSPLISPSKPRNARAARALAAREPQLVENPKSILFLRSTSTSSLLATLSQNLYALVQTHATRFAKRNTIHPFEDPSSLEFFSEKNDAALMCFASHAKKRPHTLTFARMFDHRVLDMLECLVDAASARAIAQFGGRKWRVGAKPMLSFSGPQFEDPSAPRFVLAKSLFLDFFRGEEVSEMDVEGLELFVSFAAAERGEGSEKVETVCMRVWRVVTKRSGGRLPRVELEEVGPRIDFRLGRVREADPKVMKEALRRDKTQKASGLGYLRLFANGLQPKKKKNVDVDLIGDKIGRIHVGRQSLGDLQTRKMKGLKRVEMDEDIIDEGGADGASPGVKKRKRIRTEI